jgi:NADH:ubiquinone oxidoreductase subunit E
MDKPETTITVCMGSSCFSRGNNVNVEIIERFLSERNLSGRVGIDGYLCTGNCRCGSNIRINGELLQGIEPAMVADLLEYKLAGELLS